MRKTSCFSRLEAHCKKIGHGQQNAQLFSHLTDDLIHDILEKAERQAKEAMSILGIAAKLDKNKMFETRPITKNIHEVDDDDSDIDHEEEMETKNQNIDTIVDKTDIQKLREVAIVDASVVKKVKPQ